jgi:exopolysaccharide transport family protein
MAPVGGSRQLGCEMNCFGGVGDLDGYSSLGEERSIVPGTARAAGIQIQELLRVVARHKWHLFGITAIVVLLTTLVVFQLTPEYRATAVVTLDTRQAKVTNTVDVLSGNTTVDLGAVYTELEVLRSVSLLGRVVDKLHLDADPEYGAVKPSFLTQLMRDAGAQLAAWGLTTPRAPEEEASRENSARAVAIERLNRNLIVSLRGKSYAIAISVDGTDRRKAQRIVETVSDYYIVDQLQAKLDANRRATEFFADRLDELKRNVEAAERAAAAFREKSGLTLAKDTTTIASQSLAELNSQLIQARAQRADRESRLVALEQAARNPATLGGVNEVLGNALISSLKAQAAEIDRRIGDLAQRYGDSHPRLLQARAEQAQIQGNISAEVAKIITSLRGDAEAARAKETELQDQVQQMERRAGGLGQDEVTLRQLERESQTSRAIYEDFLKRAKELRQQQDIQQPDARLLSPATVTPGPVYPRYQLALLASLIVGLGLGSIVVYVLERLDGGFRTGEQIERLTGRPMVGMIPTIGRSLVERRRPAKVAVEKPTSAYAEALRSAYTAITLGMLDRPPKVVMVTSSLPGEGKSTFVCSMAALIARSNPDKKVIVVDCDLRRSSVRGTLEVSATGGTIDECLAGAKAIDDVVGRDENSGVYYVPARSGTPNSAEILDSNAMASFISALTERFDLVFLDTPPVMAVTDALVAAKLADYIAFLVRWEQTPRDLAINCLKQLRDLRKSVGVVLAQVNVRRHSKYGYGDYGYYYSRYRSYYDS